ncbi:sensor histidine kinase [Streptomyces sp. NPDC001404]|uniref:sensor histidine kinase n=1 Tax=Streptomyces sp. NPDC001404 TaxID=3364571 RepID=UPI00368F68AE
MNAEHSLRPDGLAGSRTRPARPPVPAPPRPGRLASLAAAVRSAWRRPLLPAASDGPLRDLLCDTGIALLVAVASCLQIHSLSATGLVHGYCLSSAIAVTAAATLVLRRRTPEFCLLAGLAASFASDERTPLFAASYAVAHYGGRSRFGLVAVVAVIYLVTRHSIGMADASTAQLYYGVVVEIAFPAVFGGLVRHQRSVRKLLKERLERSGSAVESATRFALLEERTRLAFDIHDHIGHQATFLALRAGALERVPGLPGEARQGAVAVREAAHRVMADLRQMLEVLRDGDGRRAALTGPTSCAEFLGGLVRNMSAVGMAAEYRLHGTARPLPAETERLLYRICRETFTNAAKYAPGAAVSAELSFEDEQVVLEVRNGPPSGAVALRSSGRMGLTGLRLRTAEAGGLLSAEPLRDGGFRVRAELPVPAEPPAPAPAP